MLRRRCPRLSLMFSLEPPPFVTAKAAKPVRVRLNF